MQHASKILTPGDFYQQVIINIGYQSSDNTKYLPDKSRPLPRLNICMQSAHDRNILKRFLIASQNIPFARAEPAYIVLNKAQHIFLKDTGYQILGMNGNSRVVGKMRRSSTPPLRFGCSFLVLYF